eukprot:403352090
MIPLAKVNKNKLKKNLHSKIKMLQKGSLLKTLKIQDKLVITLLGTFGKVRLGTHMLTGEKVAIKILEKDKIKDQADVERVTREIHILKIVRHPNVVQLYEIIETSRQLFLIMEYASGGELFDFIVKRKRLQEPDACKFFQQIISGVEYIHKIKICHRDLKPENLLLDEKNNIKIVDFGLSNTYKKGELLKTACGSPCYAAPEMIAGKKYQGLISDVWSCGIILYAMSCGYLPFEDPNTNKLYKKILNCDYLLPGFISAPCKDLIKKILNTDPNTRISIRDLKNHEWFNQIKKKDSQGIIVGKDKVPIVEEILPKLQEQFGEDSITQNIIYILNNKHNQVTSTYYLLIKKIDRDQGKNLVFDQFAIEKRHPNQNNSVVSNISSVNFGSPQTKISMPNKLMMNQTTIGNFQRAGAQNTSKSQGKPNKNAEQNQSLVAKIYLEQMDKIYTKRTESTGQARATDSLANYNYQQQDMNDRPTKSGTVNLETLAQSMISQNTKHHQAVIRATQSQSPTSKLMNLNINMHTNASATVGIQNQNNTFYMADRLNKKNQNHNNHFNRPVSIDENVGNMIISSTNDSRIHEILPNVQRQTNNKSVHMRSTMYNNSYINKINNMISNNQRPQKTDEGQNTINITNQRQLNGVNNGINVTNVMLNTMYKPVQMQQNTMNTQAISKAIASQKVRKFRLQNRNINQTFTQDLSKDLNQTQAYEQLQEDNSSQVQPFKQDTKLFTIYRPKKQAKLTNQYTNRTNGNQSYDYSNTEQSSIVQNDKINNSFTAGPNSTASRFYNPNKHNRFLSNNYNSNMKQINVQPVFQNNFILPMSFNSAITTKTFYNLNKTNTNVKQQQQQKQGSPRVSVLDQSHQSTASTSQAAYHIQNIIQKQGKLQLYFIFYIDIKSKGTMNGTMNNFFTANTANNKRLLIL